MYEHGVSMSSEERSSVLVENCLGGVFFCFFVFLFVYYVSNDDSVFWRSVVVLILISTSSFPPLGFFSSLLPSFLSSTFLPFTTVSLFRSRFLRSSSRDLWSAIKQKVRKHYWRCSGCK